MRADDAVRAELRGADPAAPEHGQLHDVRRARRARRQQQHRVDEGTLINYLTFLCCCFCPSLFLSVIFRGTHPPPPPCMRDNKVTLIKPKMQYRPTKFVISSTMNAP